MAGDDGKIMVVRRMNGLEMKRMAAKASPKSRAENWASRLMALALAGALTGALAGCISFDSDPPERLMTLTPSAIVEAGAVNSGAVSGALAIEVPGVPQRLDVNRVPVRVDASSLAYLADAFWVEKPARLFRQLLAETIRARGDRLVVEGGELEYGAQTLLSGQLTEMGYDAASRSVIVRYDAVLARPGGAITTRRFESSVSGIAAEPASVAPALNQAANAVAIEVADWVTQQGA